MGGQAVGLPVVKAGRAPVIELVEDIPEIGIRRNSRHQILQVAQKKNDIFAFAEFALFFEPLRMRKMMQGQAKFDSAFFELLEHRQVMVQRLLVMYSLPGFDARPFDRHAESPMPQFAQQREILFPEIPEVARLAGRFRAVVCDFAVPVRAVNIVALDLMAGRRRSPEEPFRETDRFRRKNSKHKISVH